MTLKPLTLDYTFSLHLFTQSVKNRKTVLKEAKFTLFFILMSLKPKYTENNKDTGFSAAQKVKMSFRGQGVPAVAFLCWFSRQEPS